MYNQKLILGNIKYCLSIVLLLFIILPAFSSTSAATLTITRDENSITTDDGTRKLVTRDGDVAFGKEFYHTSINSGSTNLVNYSGGCGSGYTNLFGFWDCQTPDNFYILEATETRAKIRNQITTSYGNRIDWVTYPDGKNYLRMSVISAWYFNVMQEYNATAAQTRTIDTTNYTFLVSDTSNNNYAGMTAIPYTQSEIAGSSSWGNSGGSGNGWWKGTTNSPGTLFVNLSNFRATTTTTINDRDDYRNPDDLTDGLTIGSGWFDTNEQTSSSADYFNQREGVYTLNAAPNQVVFDLDGGTYTHYTPAFKIRNWRTLSNTVLLSVDGADKTRGTDYNADILPISEAWFYDSSAGTYTQIADGGYTASSDEYLNDTGSDYTMPFESGETDDYIAFGSSSKFRGLNSSLSQNGSGDGPTFTWEFWNGSTWVTLSTEETESGAKNFIDSGSIYWESDLTGWDLVTVNSGRDLYYVRARLTSGN